jgi:hypothetical protein
MIDRSRIPTPELVAIAQLVRDEAIQPRVATDSATVLEYRDAMREGAVFPPVDAVRTSDAELLLIDGWHRVQAAEREGFTKLRVRVWTGTREDAVEFAARCNIRHGLRRRAEDLAKAVAILRGLPKWRQASNIEIAKHVGVSEATVRRVQSILVSDEDADQPVEKVGAPSETRRMVRRGDQEYPMETRRIGAAQRKVESETQSEPRLRAQPVRNAGGAMMEMRTLARDLKGSEIASLIEEWIGNTEVSLALASNPAFLQRLGNNAVVAAWNSMMAWLNHHKRTVSERSMFVKAGLKSMQDEDRRKLIEEIASGAGLKARNTVIVNEPYQYISQEDSMDRIAFHWSKLEAENRRSLKVSWSWQRDDAEPTVEENPFVQ